MLLLIRFAYAAGAGSATRRAFLFQTPHLCFRDDHDHANILSPATIVLVEEGKPTRVQCSRSELRGFTPSENAAAEKSFAKLDGRGVRLLCADSISEFHKSGFSNPLTLASESEMSLIRDDLDSFIDTEKRPETFYSAVAPDEGSNVAVETIYNAHQQNNRVATLAERPTLWAEALLGGPVRVWRTTFWIKRAGARRVEWHQDTYKDENLGSFPNVNAWIAIDDAPAENCLSFLPGSHKSIIPLEHFRAPAYLEALRRNGDLPNPPVGGIASQVPLRSGQCVLFDGRVLHGSAPNKTARRRAGLVIRFVPRDLELRHKY